MRNIMRWNPQNEPEVADPFTSLERMFNDLWRMPYQSTDTSRPLLRPAMDVVENDDSLNIRVDLPGVPSDKVQVEVENDTLTISGEMGDTIEQDGDRYHYRERRYGSFQRSIRLPNTVDADKVDASFENGVLNIALPKLPQAQPKQIEIKTSKKK